jgi:type I restriction enzyme, S subunit
VRNLRTLLKSRTQRNRPDLPLLSVVREKGVIRRSLTGNDENHNFIPDDLSNYKVARAGDLVINKMKAWQGSLGIAPCDGIVSPAYFVFDFKVANRTFGQSLLRSRPYVGAFARASDGVRVGQWDLSINGMRQIPVLVPPSDEQTAIVRFLNYANRRLDLTIRAKRKVIALLNEQKQAIIHRAVTRGLDPNVPLKSSGIPWLGEIPAHWVVKSLKRWVEINRETLPEITDSNYDLKYLDIGAVATGYLVAQPEIMKFGDAPSRARRILRKGDTIISTVRTYLKAVYFLADAPPNLIASTGFAVLTPSEDTEPEFLSFVIQRCAFGWQAHSRNSKPRLFTPRPLVTWAHATIRPKSATQS